MTVISEADEVWDGVRLVLALRSELSSPPSGTLMGSEPHAFHVEPERIILLLGAISNVRRERSAVRWLDHQAF